MQSKHVVFAALICILSAGAVIAAITGQSGTISTANNSPQITLTPVAPLPQGDPTATESPATETVPTLTITSTGTPTTTNEPQTSSSTSGQ